MKKASLIICKFKHTQIFAICNKFRAKLQQVQECLCEGKLIKILEMQCRKSVFYAMTQQEMITFIDLFRRLDLIYTLNCFKTFEAFSKAVQKKNCSVSCCKIHTVQQNEPFCKLIVK